MEPSALCLSLNTHLEPMAFFPAGNSTSFQVPLSSCACSSSIAALLHSSASGRFKASANDLGSLEMALKAFSASNSSSSSLGTAGVALCIADELGEWEFELVLKVGFLHEASMVVVVYVFSVGVAVQVEGHLEGLEQSGPVQEVVGEV